MIKYYLPLVLSGCLIFGCESENTLPVEEEKLVKILCDIHFAEAALDKLNGPAKDSTAIKLYNQIFTIHGVSEAEVDTCLYYLKRDPIAMSNLYEKVMEEFEKMKLKVQSEKQ